MYLMELSNPFLCPSFNEKDICPLSPRFGKPFNLHFDVNTLAILWMLFTLATVFLHWGLIGWSLQSFGPQSVQMAFPPELYPYFIYCFSSFSKKWSVSRFPSVILYSKKQIISAVWGETSQKQSPWNNCFKQISSWRSIRQVLLPPSSVIRRVV